MSRSSQTGYTRRDLIRGSRPEPVPSITHILPWANSAIIADKCTGCGDCVTACQEQIIVISPANCASVNFDKGECTFCGDCASVCNEDVFWGEDIREQSKPWQGLATVHEGCLAHKGIVCEVCKDQCPEAAIKFKPRLGAVAIPEINEEKCTACGACVTTCPSRAVKVHFAATALEAELEEGNRT